MSPSEMFEVAQQPVDDVFMMIYLLSEDMKDPRFDHELPMYQRELKKDFLHGCFVLHRLLSPKCIEFSRGFLLANDLVI